MLLRFVYWLVGWIGAEGEYIETENLISLGGVTLAIGRAKNGDIDNASLEVGRLLWLWDDVCGYIAFRPRRRRP